MSQVPTASPSTVTLEPRAGINVTFTFAEAIPPNERAQWLREVRVAMDRSRYDEARRSLTPRLALVFDLVQQGYSDKELAERLGISWMSARTYVQRLLRRMGVSGRSGLLRLANELRYGGDHEIG